MTESARWSVFPPKAIAIVLLVAASVALTLGFACAVPFAAFATISAMLFTRIAALGAVLSVWLANQIIGFTLLNYPTDPGTFAWGLALGVIAVGSLGMARAVFVQLPGLAGAGLAFVAAFAVYEGAIYATCLASGTDVSHFTFAIVSRIFVINAVTFTVFVAFWALALRTAIGRRIDASLGLRHA